MADTEELGPRLSAQGRRLSLLLEHLTGRAVRRRVELADLAQEVFLRALTSSGGVPPPEPGEAALARWLNTIARHVVIDAARAARAAKRDGREERLARSDWTRVGPAHSHLADGGPGPATVVAAAEGERNLLAAYRTLAADHRRVLGLRQFEGLSAAETGRRMGRSEAAVHSLYRRALQAWEEAAAAKKPDRRDDSAHDPRPESA